MKIVVCASMTCSKKMVELEKKLSELGHETVLPALTHEYAEYETEDQMHSESVENKLKFMKEYFDEIAGGDCILVVNEDRKGIKNYIGGNTLMEMTIACYLNKPIYLLNDTPQIGYTDEIVTMQPIILNGKLEEILKEP